MVGISVTEPDIGSDVAGVKCRAERRGADCVIHGPKAWCTFAGRAERARGARAHRSGRLEGREGPLALHRAEGAASTGTASR